LEKILLKCFKVKFFSINDKNIIFFSLGKAEFLNLKFYHEPNKNVSFFITSDIIEKYFSNFLNKNKKDYEITLNGGYAFLFSVNLRKCIPGEIFRSDIRMFVNN
jgi:hypothetical protein